ncbi:MAG: exo-alpha-sialidase [Candidatus Hydrogenedentes bacterium]|nr:exo-alpha-sialidase [Candidatus Hydrogenedentota bacterium]
MHPVLFVWTGSRMRESAFRLAPLLLLAGWLITPRTMPVAHAEAASEPSPWKVQVALFDDPDFDRLSVGDATQFSDDAIWVPTTAWPRSGVERYEWYEEGDAVNLQLVSRDRGLTWAPHQGDPLPERHFVLKDGSFLRVSWTGYQQHPISEQAAYEKAGYFIYLLPGKDVFAIGGGFQTSRSTNGGKTWVAEDIKLPKRADVAGYGMATTKMLSDGTILMPLFGTITRRHRVRCASVIRSQDGGRNWELIDIAVDDSPAALAAEDLPPGLWENAPTGVHAFDEAQLVKGNQPGRVIAIVEEQFTKELYCCISEDSGKNWTAPKPTGMIGVTPLLLRLQSGAIACAYTNRYNGDFLDRGMRVCYSHDDGKTWDINDLVILKNDNARADGQCLWNLVQFSDGTLFASGWGTKRGCGDGHEVGYAVGFRFTETFRRPLYAEENARGAPAEIPAKTEDPFFGVPGPWNARVVLYDNTRAGSVTPGDAVVLEDDTVIMPLNITWRGPFMGYDWYRKDNTLQINVASRDRGISWQVYPNDIPKQGFRLRDGALLRIVWLGYQPHPNEEKEKWEKAGYLLYDIPEKKSFSVTGPFQVEISCDDGKTWEAQDIQLPHRAFLAGYSMHTARQLSDGTVLLPVFGYQTRRHKTYSCSVIRSTDEGQTWQLITLAQDPRPEAVSDTDIPSGTLWAKFPDIQGFDEAAVLETKKPGRVIAVIEESWSKKLYGCISEDSGLTWTAPKLTGMAGINPLLLRLKSGAIACAYTNRYEKDANRIGMTVCYSHDDGETWDTDNVAILKDDNARRDGQLIWNFLQFSDGTLFACGYSAKRGCGGGDEVGYAVGFRFTEDYRTPLRMANVKAKSTATKED